MALHRGIQSALFYYLSCAPCTGYSQRQKRRKEAKRDRVEKHQMELENPGLYRHPSPYATNPNWQAEIDLGPHPHVQAKRKKDKDQKPPKPAPSGVARLRTSNDKSPPSNVTSSTSLVLCQGDSNNSAATLNLGHAQQHVTTQYYQREDEELTSYARDPRTSNLSPISRPATAVTARTDTSHKTYLSSLNPPINDMHPAIVTKLDDRDDVMWMLQPPPTAKIMNGKQYPNTRSSTKSDSGSSRQSTAVSRRISQRTTDDRSRSSRDLLPAIELSRTGSSRTSNRPDNSPISQSETPFADTSNGGLSMRQKRRPPPISVSQDLRSSPLLLPHNDSAISGGQRSSTDSQRAAHARRTRNLSPIASEKIPSRHSSFHATGKENSTTTHTRSAHSPSARDRSADSTDPRARTRRRPALSPSARQDSSLNVLQELVQPHTLLNVPAHSKTPSFEARIELPSAGSDEEAELLGLGLGSGKPGFESWYHDGGSLADLGDWVMDRVRRDVTSRWSVDF